MHVLGIDGTCARVAASLNRWLCRYARTQSSCLSPNPETLNPETESGTWAGPGPGPLCTPPAARECEAEQTCEFCGQKAILVRMEMARTYGTYEQLSIDAAARSYEKSLLKHCGDQRPPTWRNRRFPGSTHRMMSFRAALANTNVRLKKHQQLGASTRAFTNRICERIG